MYVDAFLLFDDAAEHLTTEAGTNVVDLTSTAAQIGVGTPIYFVAIVDTAMTDASSDSTMTLTLETDTTSAFGSATTAQTIGTFAATSAAGTKLVAAVQPFTTGERYLRLKYTVANGNLTTGNFTAFLTTEPQLDYYYPDNITIS